MEQEIDAKQRSENEDAVRAIIRRHLNRKCRNEVDSTDVLQVVWKDFFAEWNRKVARGEQAVPAFPPQPVPPFQPVKMPEQGVIQEQDGKS